MGLTFAAGDQINRWVKAWLLIGLVMVFMQVVLGGITRLTGSGLSITKWEIIPGTLPPLNAKQWQQEFDLYKQTPQYEKINQGMTMSQFKYIYFWEYFHRLWARTMGFVFLLPFLYFLFAGRLSKVLIRDLLIVVLLTGFVASLGWIMVASGLVNRPWVNAYKLSMHLCSALLMFSYFLWACFKVFIPDRPVLHNKLLITLSKTFLFVLAVQIFLGGVMSGMKAGLFYPTWPDMNGAVIPEVLLSKQEWSVDNFVYYDKNSFMPAFIQFTHRFTAYLLIVIGLALTLKLKNQRISQQYQRTIIVLITMLVIQAVLGILTVIHCKGSIPLILGVLHQAGAIFLLSISLYLVYISSRIRY